MIATENGRTNTVNLFKPKGRCPSSDEYGRTALMIAAENNRADALDILLGHGADIDAQDENGRTALMIATELGARARSDIF